MNEPTYVTEITERKPIYLPGICCPVCFFEKDLQEFWESITNQSEFTFHGMRSKGFNLYYELMDAVREKNEEKARKLLEEMTKHTIKNYTDKSPVEKWEHFAVQMPGDIGGPRKKDIKKFLTRRAKGRVLETMCGFNSYFGNSNKISEVIVLDFTRAMLQRYEYPQRTRILYDLETIANGSTMTFFKDGSFQTIGCWGSNYLSEPVSVFKEFKRILSGDGQLLILESTSEGYTDLIKRYFNPLECAENMKKAGLNPTIKHLKWLKSEGEVGEYYLVEGKH